MAKQKKAEENWGTLFASEEGAAQFGGNQLSETARLTNRSAAIAEEIFNKVTADYETYADKVKASQTSHDAMDDLISELHDLGSEEVDYLKSLEDEVIDKMIRSQQSKRSRAKSKTMTRENYLTMMTGAIAENLLRIAGDKPKSAGGASMGTVGYSEKDLEHFVEQPEELKKAIRNVQSKKSIMKSKADFDAESPRYLQLLETEAQLKELRGNATSKASKEAQEALTRQQKLAEMLESANAEEMDPEQASEMLDSIKSMLASM